MRQKTRKVLLMLLAVIMFLSGAAITKAAKKTYVTEPQVKKITVDSKAITARSYSINFKATVYVKVRDIANALRNTDKKFDVVYNKKKNTLTIKPGQAYTAIGGENKKIKNINAYLKVIKSEDLTDDDDVEMVDRGYYTGTTLYKNSTKQNTKVYMIDNEQYVALSSLAEIADFYIEYNVKKDSYDINTKVGYAKSEETQIPSTNNSSLLKEPFPGAKLINSPKTVTDCYNIITYLAVNSKLDYTFATPPDIDAQKLQDNFTEAIIQNKLNANDCPELFLGVLNAVYVTVESNGIGNTVSIKFNGLAYTYKLDKPLETINEEYMSKTKAAVQSLIDTGKITGEMTQYEKAEAICYWIAENVEYKDELGMSIEHTGYSAIVKGKAVCSGYTSLYNLMCRYIGITEIQGVVGNVPMFTIPHMWTAQVLDGVKVMTDATWCDCNWDRNDIDLLDIYDLAEYSDSYFAQSAKDFAMDHTWDTDNYPEWNTAEGIQKTNEDSNEEVEDVMAEDRDFE